VCISWTLKCLTNVHTRENRSRGPTALVCPTLCRVLKIKADHANVDGVVGNMDVKSLRLKYHLNVVVVPFL
jgi:hypothetical protein